MNGSETTTERLRLHRSEAPVHVPSFADDVRAGLDAQQKRLSPKYFYDELGSALFEAICALPEYGLTRAEMEILTRDAPAMVAALPGPLDLVEFGSGSARKTRALIEAALAAQGELTYRPIDISPTALVDSAETLVAAYPTLRVEAYASDYTDLLASGTLRGERRVLALFLGSNIGNYEPTAACGLLSAMARALRSDDGLLLGADRKKDAAVLERAYDDKTGVTAAFDKNLLGRINRELGGEFDLDGFEHAARYDVECGVVESFLVAKRRMSVRIAALETTVAFSVGETIHTESSYKFDEADVAALAAAAGFRVTRRWTDSKNGFAVSLLVVH